MGDRKKKTVFTAEPWQLAQIQALIQAGHFRSTSAFLREAINDKLAALQRSRLAEQVGRYCADGHDEEDGELIEVQAFEEHS